MRRKGDSVCRGVAVMLLFLACWPERGCGDDPEVAPPRERGNSGADRVHRCRPGPWGSLEFRETFLEAPLDLVAMLPVPSRKTIWRFNGMSPDAVLDHFRERGIPEETAEKIKAQATWYLSDQETSVLPDDSLLEELSPSHRRIIYALLSRWRINPFHRNPTIIDSDSVTEWLERSDLPPSIVELVEKVAYPLGKKTAFSDLPLVLSKLETELEEKRFLRAITRSRSLVLRMRLDGSDEPGSIIDFWTAKRGFQDTLPLLKSVVTTPEAGPFDTAQFLPPIPRKHLYTYPSLSTGQGGHYPDSFWLVFNFFRAEPEETPTGIEEIEKRLEAEYEAVPAADRFGDVVIFRDGDTGRLLHGCVLVADDVVMTKNGPSIFRPFVLSRIPHLERYWHRKSPPVLETLRIRKIPAPMSIPQRILFKANPG